MAEVLIIEKEVKRWDIHIKYRLGWLAQPFGTQWGPGVKGIIKWEQNSHNMRTFYSNHKMRTKKEHFT